MTLHPWNLPTGSSEASRGAGGIALKCDKIEIAMYLWLYEWNLFDAIQAGQHTPGMPLPFRHVSADRRSAVVEGRDFRVTFHATPNGADLSLLVTNNSDHDWPEIAGVIPCYNPGPAATRSRQFADAEHVRTYFLGAGGLEPLTNRAMHFNTDLRRQIDLAAGPGGFVFSSKWPTSPLDATGGILIRESFDGKWVTGIAWEDFLAVQGHNPWQCLHACVRVGPLKRREVKTVRGKLYLMPGNRESCLREYRRDFRKAGPD